jgi:urate oxidase
MTRLVSQSYGKSRIRLLSVLRSAAGKDVRQLMVDVNLEGGFEPAYTRGDNAAVLPTDTMKNVVYVLAKRFPPESIPTFAGRLAEHFVSEHAQVSSARVEIEETPWQRIASGGEPHPSTFVGGSSHRSVCRVVATRDALRTSCGVRDLQLLKISGSAFEGFLKAEFTTLAETPDRVLATAVDALWSFRAESVELDACNERAREALVASFADFDSRSVQHQLHAMGQSALETSKQLESIQLSLSNRHHVLVDLSPFGLENSNEVFVVTDEPQGSIVGTLEVGS